MHELFAMEREEILKAFGVRLKELRKQKGWTQKELAGKVGIRFSQLNKYESGLHAPPPETLIELAETLGATLDYLLTGDRAEDVPLHSTRLLGAPKPGRGRVTKRLASSCQEAPR